MRSISFQQRLRGCLHGGNLTVSDLARWFNRPDPTVRGWVGGGHLGGPVGDAADTVRALNDLEHRIRQKRGFPVPRLSPGKRMTYLKSLQRRGKPNGA